MYGFGGDALDALQRQLDQMRQQTMPTVQQPVFDQGTAGNIVWVQGIEGAKGRQIARDASVIMLDSENENTMYIKYSDPAGLCKMKTFRFEEVSPPARDESQFVTREDVKSIILEMMGQEAKHDEVISGDCWVQDEEPARKQRGKQQP